LNYSFILRGKATGSATANPPRSRKAGSRRSFGSRTAVFEVCLRAGGHVQSGINSFLRPMVKLWQGRRSPSLSQPQCEYGHTSYSIVVTKQNSDGVPTSNIDVDGFAAWISFHSSWHHRAWPTCCRFKLCHTGLAKPVRKKPFALGISQRIGIPCVHDVVNFLKLSRKVRPSFGSKLVAGLRCTQQEPHFPSTLGDASQDARHSAEATKVYISQASLLPNPVICK
jgi:hypothetical protein